jgi:putative tRNA adenosine deaminase-associated protein
MAVIGLQDGGRSETIFLAATPHGATMTDSGSDDVAVIVYREDDAWDADLLPTALTEDLAGLMQVLRQQPSIGGTIGLAAVGDDFFVAIRVIGGQESVFLSDLTAAVDWPLARQVLAHLDLVIPDDEDLDQVLPAGDLSIFADLGLDEMDLGMIAGDLDLFPDEALAIIARKLGFGQALERALCLAPGHVLGRVP